MSEQKPQAESQPPTPAASRLKCDYCRDKITDDNKGRWIGRYYQCLSCMNAAIKKIH